MGISVTTLVVTLDSTVPPMIYTSLPSFDLPLLALFFFLSKSWVQKQNLGRAETLRPTHMSYAFLCLRPLIGSSTISSALPWNVCTFSSPNSATISSTAFNFFPTESTRRKSTSGYIMARGTPGNPPPVPTSTILDLDWLSVLPPSSSASLVGKSGNPASATEGRVCLPNTTSRLQSFLLMRFSLSFHSTTSCACRARISCFSGDIPRDSVTDRASSESGFIAKFTDVDDPYSFSAPSSGNDPNDVDIHL
mmetsp:Transcript_26282/g.40174  ORF Transcript_26282/g.40174 Transcript_26282/m.40174 type:complete len:250 (-) Transcript_26282:262-1011(-)